MVLIWMIICLLYLIAVMSAILYVLLPRTCLTNADLPESFLLTCGFLRLGGSKWGLQKHVLNVQNASKCKDGRKICIIVTE